MLKRLKSLSKDTMLYGLSSMTGQLVGFLLLPVYTKYLVPEDYGILAMLVIVTTLFVPLFGLGLKPAIYRYVSRAKSERSRRRVIATASAAAALFGGTGLIFLVAVSPLIAPCFIDDAPFWFIIFSLCSGFCMLLDQIMAAVLRYDRRVMAYGLISITGMLISIATIILLVVVLNWGVVGCLVGNLVGAVLRLGMLLAVVRPFFKGIFRRRQLRLMLHYGLPFIPHQLQAVGLIYLGQFILKSSVSLEEAGLYNIAIRFVLPFQLLVQSIQSAWKPIKFQIYNNDINAKQTFRDILSIYCTLTGLFFLLFAFLGPPLLIFMVNERFHDAAEMVPFLALLPLAKGLYFMLGTGIEFSNSPRKMPLVSLFGILVLLLCSPAILVWHGIGAAVATAAAWLAMALAVFLFSQSVYSIKYDYFFLIAVTVSTCVAGLAIAILSLSILQTAVFACGTGLACVVGLAFRVHGVGDLINRLWVKKG